MAVSFDSSVISSRIWRALAAFLFAHMSVIATGALQTRTQASRQEVERTSCQANATAAHSGRAFAAARSASDDWPLTASQRARPACVPVSHGCHREPRLAIRQEDSEALLSLPREAAITDSGPLLGPPSQPLR